MSGEHIGVTLDAIESLARQASRSQGREQRVAYDKLIEMVSTLRMFNDTGGFSEDREPSGYVEEKVIEIEGYAHALIGRRTIPNTPYDRLATYISTAVDSIRSYVP